MYNEAINLTVKYIKQRNNSRRKNCQKIAGKNLIQAKINTL